MQADEQQIVDQLLQSNNYFRALHERHEKLNREVDATTSLSRPADVSRLAHIKKQKLLTRDKMTRIIAEHRINLSTETD